MDCRNLFSLSQLLVTLPEVISFVLVKTRLQDLEGALDFDAAKHIVEKIRKECPGIQEAKSMFPWKRDQLEDMLH